MSDITQRALELYETPFYFHMGYIVDAKHRPIADDQAQDCALRALGRKRISHLPEPGALQDEVGRLMAIALTEYWDKHKPNLAEQPSA
jgi:hypothetical protein